MSHWVIIIIIIVVIGAALFYWQTYQQLTPAAEERVAEKKAMTNVQKVSLTASDGVVLAADWYPAVAPQKYFVLVHMMPATKESWQELAKRAQAKGYGVLAIDLRGHGQSQAGPNGYRNFSDSQHQESKLDLQAAVDYLKKQGATAEQVSIIGASIGANLALQYIVEHPEFKAAGLLSPGLNYRGIETLPLAARLQQGQRVWLSAADDDNNGLNSQWVKEIYEAIDGEKVLKVGVNFKKGGHGTDIFKASPELMDKLIGF